MTADGVYRLFGSNRQAYIRYWEARMGAEAAEARWTAARLRVLAQVPEVVWFPSIVVGIWEHWPILVVIGVVLAACSFVACILMFVARHKMYSLASQHLGLKISWRNGWRKLPVQGSPPDGPTNPRGG